MKEVKSKELEVGEDMKDDSGMREGEKSGQGVSYRDQRFGPQFSPQFSFVSRPCVHIFYGADRVHNPLPKMATSTRDLC
jgi:hypothetical protein